MRRLVTALVVSLLPISVAAQAPSAPAEAKRLAYFAGTWNFSGTVKDGPMGKGGPITFKETCEMMDGGFALVCRSEGTSPMGAVKSAAIWGYDPEKRVYTYTAAESGMPVFTATGQVQGPTWTWTSTSSMNGKPVTTRVTIKEAGAKSWDMTMEMSMDGKNFAALASGTATRP